MIFSKTIFLVAIAASLVPGAELRSVNPAVRAIVDGISEDRIAATLKKLESFQTRNIFSDQDNETQGIGAARKWIFAQFQSYSPRLQVKYDVHHLKRNNQRVVRDVDLYNVVAVLPGKVHPERQLLVCGHYDSAIYPKRGQSDEDSDEPYRPDTAAPFAPGVTDDASGVAAVMELARVMSKYEYDNTVVFVAFAGEEEGLLGSTAYAKAARRNRENIDAVLNNDIIGSDTAGNGRVSNSSVLLFSDEPADSPSREIARYVREVSARYVPSMEVDLVFRRDRYRRGGDHTPFVTAGFGGVRFTTPSENFANQHSTTDTFANTSVAYTTRVAKVNACALASLALAPLAPVIERDVTKGPNKGRKAVMIDRGTSHYAAHLRWKNNHPEADLAGYAVVMRSTTSPYWDKEIFVGKVNEYTLEDVSIDTTVFGVKAVDSDGNESLVAAYEQYPPKPAPQRSKDGAKTPEEVVEGQVEAFNAHDVDAVLAFYAPDAKLMQFRTGQVLANGSTELRARFASRFRGLPDLDLAVSGRTFQGDYVIDREKITGTADGKAFEDTMIYEVKGGRIQRAWLLD